MTEGTGTQVVGNEASATQTQSPTQGMSLHNFDPNAFLESQENKQTEASQTSSAKEQNNPVSDSVNAAQNKSTDDVLDFASLSGKKIKIGDEIFSAEQLKAERLRYADYTRKTQEMAQIKQQHEKTLEYQRKLRADVDTVKENPHLAEKFKEIYPKEYHWLVSEYEEQAEKLTPALQAEVQKVLEPHLKTLKEHQARIAEEKSKAAHAKLDNYLKTLTSKYTEADQDWVLAKADVVEQQFNQAVEEGNYEVAEFIKNKYNIGDEEKVLDAIFKMSHDKMLERYKAYNSREVSQIKQKQTKARDMASGGNLAAKDKGKPKSFEEMNEYLKTFY